MHSMDRIDHSRVQLQFNEHGNVMHIKAPYSQGFITGIKNNLVKDGTAYYEYDVVKHIWSVYSWGEDWPFAIALNLLWCFYPERQLSNINLEGMKV
jgi:hypothetical protein